MSWRPDVPNPHVPEWMHEDSKGQIRYAFSWCFANKCRALCPYCFAGGKEKSRLPLPRTWTEKQALLAWRHVFEWHGPCQDLLGGLEPAEDLELVGAIALYHYLLLVTNFMFDAETLARWVPGNKIEIHPSFHAHLWHYDIDKLLEKVALLKGWGYRVPFVSIVGYPPYLPHLDDWCEAIKSAGMWANVAPMRDAEYQGKAYPESYTEEEAAILARHTFGWIYAEDGKLRPLNVKACAAGHVFAWIQPDGAIWRCGHLPGSMGDQNLFRDLRVKWLDGPKPCDQRICGCTNLHVFHVTEEGSGEGS